MLTKNVILLNKGMTSVPTDRSSLYENDRIISCFQISTADTAEDIVTSVRELYFSKIGHLPEPGYVCSTNHG